MKKLFMLATIVVVAWSCVVTAQEHTEAGLQWKRSEPATRLAHTPLIISA